MPRPKEIDEALLIGLFASISMRSALSRTPMPYFPSCSEYAVEAVQKYGASAKVAGCVSNASAVATLASLGV